MGARSHWWSVYRKHGARIARDGLGRHKIARIYGMDLNAARRLKYYIDKHGPPDDITEEAPACHLSSSQRRAPTHLVIGDAHAGPGQDLSRFRWLARFCHEHKPDVVVCIGDWFGLDSLCKHNSPKESEKQRLQADLDAGNEALRIFDNEMRALNLKNGTTYNPRRVVTLGNHDARIMREASQFPYMHGVLSYDLMHWKSYGWQVQPFGMPIQIDGVKYCHFFTRTGSPRAISGQHHAATLVREGLGSTLVCGHSHQLHWYHRADHEGRRVHGLVVGCYFKHHEEYAGTSNGQWWRGLCLLRNVVDGDFDLETWHISRIEAKHGMG